MLEKIYSEWQHRVTKSSSSDCLPLFQRKDLFINMLELICAPNPDIHYLNYFKNRVLLFLCANGPGDPPSQRAHHRFRPD